MGSYSEEPEFKTLTIKKLHPTFGAEVEGVDFQNLSDEQQTSCAQNGFTL